MSTSRYAAVILASASLEFATQVLASRLGAPFSVNRGVAFGMLAGSPGLAVWLSLGALALLLGYVFLSREPSPVRLALSVAAGAVAENLTQRLSRGAVADWIPLPLSEALFQGGVLFNIADVEIALGVAAGLWLSLRNK